jgi:NADH dehydrogenase
VVAGAGFSGVEAIAEVSEMAEEALRHHPRLAHVEPRWVLVDGAQRILGQTPDSLARFAERTLGRRGIEIVTGTRLTAVDAEGVELSDARRIATETVVWTAGVTANPLVARSACRSTTTAASRSTRRCASCGRSTSGRWATAPRCPTWPRRA